MNVLFKNVNQFVCFLVIAFAPSIPAPSPWSPSFVDEVGPAANSTAEEIRSGIARTQSKIFAFQITYEIQYPIDEGWPTGTYLRRTVAAMQPGSFFHETAHGHSDFAWEDDSRLRRCYVSADHAVDNWVMSRSYSFTGLQPSDGLPGSMPDEFLIRATGLWPMGGRPAPRFQDGPFVLSDIGKSKQHEFVRPRQERRDGAWCHVLERPGVDRLWIDTVRGYCLMARETYQRHTGYLGERIELGGHRELNTGVWMPGWIRSTQFDIAAKRPEERTRPVIQVTADIKNTTINELVSKKVFSFVSPPGALWLDPPGGKPAQVTPGGEDLLDRMVDWSRKHALRKRPASSTLDLLSFGCVALAIASMEGLLAFARRRRSLKASKKSNV